MSQNLSQTFLAITRNDTDLEWLQGALAPLGQVVSAGGGSLDELLALVDVTFASLVFVGLDRDHLVAQSALQPFKVGVVAGDGEEGLAEALAHCDSPLRLSKLPFSRKYRRYQLGS